MTELLTAKQVQDLLLVDRTTIYRMLKDGRLNGTKIGHQWRFDRQEVQAFLSGGHSLPTESVLSEDVLPFQCVQATQDVFAEVAQVGSVTTDPQGQPLTEISNTCSFCRLILSSDSGRRACQESWRRLAQQSEQRPAFVNCHAGLQYARARIELDSGQLTAMLIAGQFYARPPDPAEETARVQRLAQTHELDGQVLTAAASKLPVLDQRMRNQIGRWLEKVAHTFEDIGRERAELMGRLRTIAEMSAI
ncbi:MAG: PocR ligand-binding domain-containing protein [Chloroflexota bacterium]|nr:PocR ligand-binding domain-containing protein [Chloroflexota bacterium]